MQIFGYTIVKTKTLESMLAGIPTTPTEYTCGYSNCRYHTTKKKGLSIHRARVHRRK